MSRAGLSAETVVAAAAELADADGLAALTLARLAARLGVRPPSLYAHVDGLEDLRGRLAALGAGSLAAALSAATVGRSGPAALRALADAYRGYGHAHPGLYAALQRPGPAGEAAVAVVLAVVAGYGLEGEPAVHATRAIRAGLHGFVSLELDDGFGMDLPLEDSWERLVAMLDRGLAAVTG